jgi:cadmium resistance protein CadD (predicted permease)
MEGDQRIVTHLLGVLATGLVVFASTNTDDLLLLVAFFAHPEFTGRQVVLGQFAGIAAIVVIAVVGSGIAAAASPAHVGLLGFLPIAWGSETPIRSRRGAVILVDEPAEQVPPANIARVDRDRDRNPGFGQR